MDRAPTTDNVEALVQEIRDRYRTDDIFKTVFPDQHHKESNGESLISRPKNFACMRVVHGWLDQECDGIMSTEYGMGYNRYVVDFCETRDADD